MHRHKAISVAICSNVPGYETGECIIDPGTDSLLTKMISRISEIQEVSSSELRKKVGYLYLFEKIEDNIKKWKQFGIDHDFDTSDNEEGEEEQPCDGLEKNYAIANLMQKKMLAFKQKLEAFYDDLPIIGLNCSRFDLNLVKSKLAVILLRDPFESLSAIKKGNSYMAVTMSKFKFLDASNFLALGGKSLKAFLKAFNIQEGKGLYPYKMKSLHMKAFTRN